MVIDGCETLGNGRNFDEIESVGDEAFKVGDVPSGYGLFGAKCRSGNHTIRMRTALAPREMEEFRCKLGLLLSKWHDATSEDGMHGVFLFFRIRTVTKF